MKKMRGLFPALVTPYSANGKLNINKIQQLVEKLEKCGVSGFYVGGSTGESYLLTVDERKKVLEAVKEAATSSMNIIANIGLIATEQSIELAQHAEQIGVDAISSVPPFYFPFTMNELCSYYEELADAVALPVLIYNIPAMSGVKFQKDNLERLLNNKKILGIKHTSYDLFQLQQLLQEYPEKTMFIGHDELFLSALAIGIDAGIGSTFNIMPEKFMELVKAFQKSNLLYAQKLQGEINSVVETLCKVGVFKGIKEILKLQGIDCGFCRKPFKPLNEQERILIRSTAEKNGLI